MAAPACSQEDYSSTRCHRLPARPTETLPEWRRTTRAHTHTHTSHTPPWTSSCYLFHLFPLLVQHFCPFPLPSSTFFSPPNASPPFFSHSLFFYRSFSLTEQQREERRGHRQVAYAPSSGLFYVLTRTEDGCPGGETTPPPSTPSTHSLTSCFSHSSSLFFPLGRKSSMFYCLSFSSFWHSHISKLLLPTLSHTSGSVKSQFVWQKLKRFHIVLWVLLFCLFFHRRPNCTEVHYGVQKYEGSEEKKEIGRRLSAACLLSEVSGVM